MRHRAAHAYFGTDLAILHEVATRRLHELVPIFAVILAPESGDA